ncbi:dolichyl-P-Man:Man(5)GlcNAc(2)-PP-dolichol alpha-1,3-mannosyltransferase [Irineochytrium annulatum]|nr:dolichyl-P-Man:Man(5)GlcNAc(2)-PP-dolichol alpha-1,3-mannosyltransferase [Irineochytrium annulatum]
MSRPRDAAIQHARATKGPINSIVLLIHSIANDRAALPCALLLLEVVLCAAIIMKVPYTEIDWKAYMQQIEMYQAGERDYSKIKGDTGPLVYPAGHVQVFALLHQLTDMGTNIGRAQVIFAGIYMLTLASVFAIYSHSKMVGDSVPISFLGPSPKRKRKQVPQYVLFALVLSKRIHSIFLLRLFNDAVSMLHMYVCIWAMCHAKWRMAAIVYSAALSIKMNILLFAPGFAFLMYEAVGLSQSLRNAALAYSIQTILALPFLFDGSSNYFKHAFDFSRAFLYKWTVNWRFVPEDVFLSSDFARWLLALHLGFLAVFVLTKWLRPSFTLAFTPPAAQSARSLRSPASSDVVVDVYRVPLAYAHCSEDLERMLTDRVPQLQAPSNPDGIKDSMSGPAMIGSKSASRRLWPSLRRSMSHAGGGPATDGRTLAMELKPRADDPASEKEADSKTGSIWVRALTMSPKDGASAFDPTPTAKPRRFSSRCRIYTCIAVLVVFVILPLISLPLVIKFYLPYAIANAFQAPAAGGATLAIPFFGVDAVYDSGPDELAGNPGMVGAMVMRGNGYAIPFNTPVTVSQAIWAFDITTAKGFVLKDAASNATNGWFPMISIDLPGIDIHNGGLSTWVVENRTAIKVENLAVAKAFASAFCSFLMTGDASEMPSVRLSSVPSFNIGPFWVPNVSLQRLIDIGTTLYDAGITFKPGSNPTAPILAPNFNITLGDSDPLSTHTLHANLTFFMTPSTPNPLTIFVTNLTARVNLSSTPIFTIRVPHFATHRGDTTIDLQLQLTAASPSASQVMSVLAGLVAPMESWVLGLDDVSLDGIGGDDGGSGDGAGVDWVKELLSVVWVQLPVGQMMKQGGVGGPGNAQVGQLVAQVVETFFGLKL